MTTGPTLTMWRLCRVPAISGRVRETLAGLAAAAFISLAAMGSTEDAVANGDTRTIDIYHTHTKESASITFKRNGYYDQDALKQLNWLLRDWRTDEPTRMEPRLFDILWEVHREVGSHEPLNVVSAYRSPGTNAMLRRRSKAVAEHSQHMLGHAMDFFLSDVSMARVREVGMRLQDGGVGFYPNAFNPFVHLDAGSVRSWPRMSRDQLAHLFPNGRTVHMPRDGHPMPGYEEAKAEILARGGAVAGYSTYASAGEQEGPRKSLWATLFGGGDDEDSDFYRSPASRVKLASRGTPTAASSYVASGNTGDGGMHDFLVASTEPAAPAAAARPSRRQRTGAPLQPTPVPASATTAPPPGPGVAPPETRLALAAPQNGLPVASGAPPIVSPQPPRRPEELAALMSDAPLPPLRPVTVASLDGSAPVVAMQLNGQMRSVAAPRSPEADDRAALKTLFETVSIRSASSRHAGANAVTQTGARGDAVVLSDPGPKVRMMFTSAALADLSTDDFSGPAVAPLPILR